MKKLLLMIIAIIAISFTACKKENVQPQHKATTLATTPTPTEDGDKGDLGQADGD